MRDLFLKYRNVVAYVAGHTHANDIHLFKKGRTGFWQINTASHADTPQQSREIEVMDNCDGTMSLFTTILDHAAPIAAPAPGTAAASFTDAQLGSLSRVLAWNDPQNERRAAAARPQHRARPAGPALSVAPGIHPRPMCRRSPTGRRRRACPASPTGPRRHPPWSSASTSGSAFVDLPAVDVPNLPEIDVPDWLQRPPSKITNVRATRCSSLGVAEADRRGRAQTRPPRLRAGCCRACASGPARAW